MSQDFDLDYMQKQVYTTYQEGDLNMNIDKTEYLVINFPTWLHHS